MTDKVTRKLTAIMSADVKGYSLLMSDDEVFTIRTLKEYRGIMSDCIEQHNGRVVDSPGDNLLAEFGSAVDAVQCAVETQRQLKTENDRLVEDKRLEFRIGVNIGDVVQDEDRIYGSGVNVAARIEGLADAGGICISRGTYDQVKDKLELGFEYLGEHEVKNIKGLVRVYNVLMDSDVPRPLVEEQLDLPDKPSIAVLPFDNMSGDPSQEYFSDGLTEQIISGLCKVKDLFVIARNSSFAYKGKSISTKQIAQELGVRYILEGSVQKAGDRVRITAQLIDATTDYHMLSESYDRDLSDLFALQDEITMRLINAMQIELTQGEQAQLWEGAISNIQAYDKYVRGCEYYYRNNKQDNARARIYFEDASKLDDKSAFIISMLGFTHCADILLNWSDSPIDSFIAIDKYAFNALSLNDSLDLPYILLSWVHLLKKNYNEAIKAVKQATVLNPNGAFAYASFGLITSVTGNPARGIILLKKAVRLSPIPQSYDYLFLGAAYRLAGQYEKAVAILNDSLKIDSDALVPHLLLASSYISLNQYEKAKKAADKILETHPNFSLVYHKSILPYKDQRALNLFIDTLRKAGLPE